MRIRPVATPRQSQTGSRSKGVGDGASPRNWNRRNREGGGQTAGGDVREGAAEPFIRASLLNVVRRVRPAVGFLVAFFRPKGQPGAGRVANGRSRDREGAARPQGPSRRSLTVAAPTRICRRSLLAR